MYRWLVTSYHFCALPVPVVDPGSPGDAKVMPTVGVPALMQVARVMWLGSAKRSVVAVQVVRFGYEEYDVGRGKALGDEELGVAAQQIEQRLGQGKGAHRHDRRHDG